MVASSEVLPQPSPSSDKSGETSVFTGYLNKQSIKIKKEKKLLLLTVVLQCPWVMVFKVILFVQFLLI